jgi:hypothetical protein
MFQTLIDFFKVSILFFIQTIASALRGCECRNLMKLTAGNESLILESNNIDLIFWTESVKSSRL